MTRSPNYARQIEAAMEPILDRLASSPQSIKVLEHDLLGPKNLYLSQGHQA
jgi:hypothetical protein